MKRRVVKTLLVCVLLVLALSGCRDSTSADKKSKKENAATKVEESKENDVKSSDPDEKDTSTTDTSTTPGASEPAEQTTPDSTKEAASNKNSTKQNTTNKTNAISQSANKDVHAHNWVEVTQTITHPEEGHYETVEISGPSEIKEYGWRTFCNKCNADLSDLKPDEIAYHSAILCESGYHADYVVVNVIRKEAVTEEKWVVDIVSCTETVVTGYKCECGETLEAITPSASREAFDLINQERLKLGLQPAVWDSTCEKIAKIRAREVFAIESLNQSNAHEGMLKFQNVNRRLGECIAWGYGSASGAVNGWMNSSGHRATLMAEEWVHLAIYRMGDRWVAVNSR